MALSAQTVVSKIVLPLVLGGGISVLLTGCSGSDDNGRLSMSEAFCNDLRSGASPFSILMPLVRDGLYTARVMADRAYGWAANECPEQLRQNELLRSYLQGWNINPDL